MLSNLDLWFSVFQFFFIKLHNHICLMSNLPLIPNMHLKFWYLVTFRRYEHLKFASHFAYFWRQFLSDFDVRPCKSKLMTSSTRIWKNCVTMGPIRYLKMAKCAKICCFGMFLVPYRPPSGKILSYSCRGGHKLQNEWCYINIGQVLRSEMSKEW